MIDRRLAWGREVAVRHDSLAFRQTGKYVKGEVAARGPVGDMIVLFRAVVYATVFISLVLVFLPARILEWSGVSRIPSFGVQQAVGTIAVLLGASLAIWCVLTFALLGRGTPAPFDPPRRLVVRGPYRYVRNPMYIGAAIALSGAAVFYRSLPMLGYLIAFLPGGQVKIPTLWPGQNPHPSRQRD